MQTSIKPPEYLKRKGKAEPTADQLEAIRLAARQLRDLKLAIDDTQTLLDEQQSAYNALERSTLPDLFADAGIDRIGLEPEGNLPAFDLSARPYYHASIAQSWPQDQKDEAFDWVSNHGGADLIKSVIIVTLPKGSTKMRERIEAGLRKVGVEFTSNLSIHASTLTSFVRELIEKRKIMPPLDVLGADVGRRVNIKARKE